MNPLASPQGRRPSLLGRMLKGFAAVLLLAWSLLIAREVYDVKVSQQRYAKADNEHLARGVLLLIEPLKDLPPQRLAEALAAHERLRHDFWQAKGYNAPWALMQIWLDGRQVHADTPALRSARPAELTPPPALPEDRDWNQVQVGSADGRLLIRRWQEVPGYWHFSNTGMAYYARPLLMSLPLLLLPAWLILRRGLRPLRQIGHQIEHRDARDLTPLPDTPYAELAPVVDAVNRLMARLSQRLNWEREFLVDAAHELKTPLAVIEANAYRLQCAAPQPAAALAREGLHEGVQRITHTVHQLLSLMRSGADAAAASEAQSRRDFAALLRDRLALLAPLAHRRGVELELQGPEQAGLKLDREGMASLLDNLIDNAIKYAATQVLVRLEGSEAAGWRLSVCDDGPGIPPQLHAKVFERFYRLPGQEQPGSGLGLAIVEQVAARHHATIALGTGLDGRGLGVTLVFAPDPGSAQLQHQAGLARQPVALA
ncbi:two-component sensor histidine kinase [Roseateles sp. DAIF2]|uniref:ATP-binding protein n=1 Tax=Roseateles sp. DAIF2 TaxID=2714952 RepID=UPI0018A2CCE5|nr:ATP-binding protein [Roseateles sp. DAIF2]QPF75750.1 two-component sensor histidine kinase [Roseateles sp. DAIF2]